MLAKKNTPLFTNRYLGKEDPTQLQEFESRIAQGHKIEPSDWMPQLYRKQLLRVIERHAHSELIGALHESEWILKAPGFKRKMALMAKIQDELGHAQILYRAAETLGKSRKSMIDDLISGKSRYINIFYHSASTWADLCLLTWLVDAGSIVSMQANAKGSYGPYCRALDHICSEENFHLKFGHHCVIHLADGSKAQRQMMQEAIDKWWFPILRFFGPQDKLSVHTNILMELKIKMLSNDDCRNEFLNLYVPKILELGFTIPDALLKKNNTSGRWEYSDLNWQDVTKMMGVRATHSNKIIKERETAIKRDAWVRKALLTPKMD